MIFQQEILCRFITTLPPNLNVPPDLIMVPKTINSPMLSNMINNFLEFDDYHDFEFCINGQLLRTSLGELADGYERSVMKFLNIEYFYRFVAPRIRTVRSHTDWVSAVAGFAREEIILTYGCYQGHLRLNKPKIRRRKLEVAAHRGPVTALCVYKSKMATFITTVGKDGMAHIWRADLNKDGLRVVARMPRSENALQAIAVSPCGSRCAVGGWDAEFRLFTNAEAAEKELSHIYGDQNKIKEIDPMLNPIASACRHKGCISGLAWPSENIIFSGSMDLSLCKWDLGNRSTPSCVATLNTPGAVTCTAANPTTHGWIVAFGSTDKVLRVWDSRVNSLQGKSGLHKFSAHENWISTLSWCPSDENLLTSGSYDGTIKIWDRRASEPLMTLEGASRCKVLDVSWFLPRMIVSGGTDCKVNLFHVKT